MFCGFCEGNMALVLVAHADARVRDELAWYMREQADTPVSILRTSSSRVAKRVLRRMRAVGLVVTGREGLDIAAAAKRRHVAVLMVDNPVPLTDRARRCGVNVMLSLPINPGALADRVHELLALAEGR